MPLTKVEDLNFILYLKSLHTRIFDRADYRPILSSLNKRRRCGISFIGRDDYLYYRFPIAACRF